jgi:LmbE family N-acetylglucosaminyl deacetylase
VSRGLAIVAAHPDDDTFGATGSAALHATDEEFRLTVVVVTSGDAGEIADPSLATPETLGPVREAEDRASWAALGRPPDRHEFLRYPDGGVADADQTKLVERIAAVLREEQPDVVVTFGPDGVTGHSDHVTVGAATTKAFEEVRGEQGARGFRRLLYNVLPRSMIEWFSAELVARGGDPIDPSAPYQPSGVPDDAIGVAVDCRQVWKRKFDALFEHKTQGSGDFFPEDLRARILSMECFEQAWPAREPDATVLGDVFEGLDGYDPGRMPGSWPRLLD